jgi:hypothetical protein
MKPPGTTTNTSPTANSAGKQQKRRTDKEREHFR